MRFYEIVGDYLLNLPIVEQASKRSLVSQSISALSKQAIIHLIKIYKFENPIDSNKHGNDIDTWLDDIYDYKLKGNKYPSANDYYDWMYTYWVDDVSFVTRQARNLMKGKYAGAKVIRSDEDVHNIIKDIMNRVSVDMGNRQFNSIDDYI